MHRKHIPQPRALFAALGATVALALGLPAIANADVASYDGSTVTIQGSNGNESIVLSLTGSGDLSVNTDEAGPGCAMTISGVVCPIGPGGIVANMGGGNDHVTHLGLAGGTLPDGSLRVDLGPGDDEFKGDDGRETVSGGPGNDTLTGGAGDDVFDGGDGNDILTGDGGRDQLVAGAGDDTLDGDRFEQPAADLIDGGPGNDKVEGWTIPDQDVNPPASMTLDGVANDGRPGEGDDVRSIERITSNVSGNFVFGDSADVVEVWANLDYGTSTIRTNGGADRVTGANSIEQIDGGAGDDRLEGGYGDDTIVGGPGRDTIIGDKSASDCGWFESCSLPQGNDTIDARDGEADSVSCGVGTDTVTADPADTVGGDCEHVNRAAAGGSAGSKGAGKACVVPKLRGLKLAAAKRKLSKARCSANVRYAKNRKLARGRVIKASAKPGKRLKSGARVTLIVSRGRH